LFVAALQRFERRAAQQSHQVGQIEPAGQIGFPQTGTLGQRQRLVEFLELAAELALTLRPLTPEYPFSLGSSIK
jgi:hypothetical protein